MSTANLERELDRLLGRWTGAAVPDFRLFEDPETCDIEIEQRPLVLLGAGSAYARDFAAQAEPGQIVGAIDQRAAGGVLGGMRIETDDILPALRQRHPRLTALVMAESPGADRHFRALCGGLDIPLLGPLHSFRRAGFAMTGVLGMLYDRLTETVLGRQADWPAVAALLADEVSREIFRALLLFRLSFERRYIELALSLGKTAPSSPPWLGDPVRGDHVFVDGGAFDGDTVQDFLDRTGGRYDRIYAFEPDAENFHRLQSRFGAADRVHCIEAALSDEPGILRFSAGSGHSSGLSETGTVTVAAEAVDRVVMVPVTALKLDIEGAEAAALAGAAEQIRRNRPGLAIAAYHRPGDLFDLPRQIAGLVPTYRFALRHHTHWTHDSILYAW
jgi:FkbM family methyltransferase